MAVIFLQGINPVISVFAIIILVVFSLFISWWSYSYLQEAPLYKKNSLILLRATAFIVLIILLLNPFSVKESTTDDQPSIAVYLDNSQSISVSRGDYRGIADYSDYIQSLYNAESEQFVLDTYLFDHQVFAGNEPNGIGTSTNLQLVTEHFRENENRYVGAILFTDGIVTRGRNPVFTAQNISKPIVTVPVGDTTSVRDIAITGIDAAESTFTFTRQTVRVELQQQGYEDDNTNVSIYRNGNEIVNEYIEFSAIQSSHIIEFTEEFTEPGLFTYEVVVPAKDDEFTAQNNRRRFNIEVVDNKTNIFSIAFEIHPDVGTFRRLIASDQQNELFSATVLPSGRLIGDSLTELDELPDLIVLHGLPAENSNIAEWISNSSAPVLYIALPQSHHLNMASGMFPGLLPYSFESSGPEIQVQLNNFLTEEPHPILEVPTVNFQRLPRLFTKQTEYQFSPMSNVLVWATHQQTETSTPMLIIEESTTVRKASVNGYNWYLFSQNEQSQTREFFEHLFTNIINWTASTPDRENLSIETDRDSYNENEDIIIRGRLFNDLGEPESDGIIDLRIFESNSEEAVRNFRMNHRQDEEYISEIGRLPTGLYRAEARATKQGRNLGSDQLVINVGESVLEFMNTKRNDSILRQLANITNGIFLDDYDFESAFTFFQQQIDRQQIGQTSTEVLYWHRSGVWFVLLLMILSAEWLLRRNISLP